MKWRKHDGSAIVSEDGRYAIARLGAAYEVWRTRKHEEGPHLCATNIGDAQEARRLAEADSRE